MKKKLAQLQISKNKHMENFQKEIQEKIQKCYSKRYVCFANVKFLVFPVHNQKLKLWVGSEHLQRMVTIISLLGLAYFEDLLELYIFEFEKQLNQVCIKDIFFNQNGTRIVLESTLKIIIINFIP